MSVSVLKTLTWYLFIFTNKCVQQSILERFFSAGATCSATSSAGTRIPPVPARAEGAGQSVLLPENLAATTVD